MLISDHGLILLLLALLVTILAVYTGLDLSRHSAVRPGLMPGWWLIAGACAMGLGIWCVHLIGMHVLGMPFRLGEDWLFDLLCLAIAIVAAALALWLAGRQQLSRPHLLLGALASGAAISSIHYVGMMGMPMMSGMPYWPLPTPLVFLMSCAILGFGAVLALVLQWRQRAAQAGVWRLALAVIIGLAIVGLHYGSMRAGLFLFGSVCTSSGNGADADLPAWLMVIAMAVLLATALLVSWLEARLGSRRREKKLAYKKIKDSIAYASLIQRSLLPGRLLNSIPGINCSVLWLPRDMVGGDFYLCHRTAHGCLLGVVDCAGHGVPGALMTMLAHAAIDQSLALADPADPAALLTCIDLIVRQTLEHDARPQMLATNMDIALAYLDFSSNTLSFAGAKIDLYSDNGREVQQLRGARRAIGDKRGCHYSNTQVALAGQTFYLTTDGFLDQAGGEHAYGFGSTRFRDMIMCHAGLPPASKAAAFKSALDAYQGAHKQRDDITMLCFRFDPEEGGR